MLCMSSSRPPHWSPGRRCSPGSGSRWSRSCARTSRREKWIARIRGLRHKNITFHPEHSWHCLDSRLTDWRRTGLAGARVLLVQAAQAPGPPRPQREGRGHQRGVAASAGQTGRVPRPLPTSHPVSWVVSSADQGYHILRIILKKYDG